MKNKKKDGILHQYWKHKSLFLLLVPVIVYYAIFNYWPIYGVTIAFKDFYPLKGVADSPWVGLKYFERLFSDMFFWRSFRNTIIISGGKFLIGFPAPIILALLLDQIKNAKAKKTFQTITYMPHFISWVVLSGILIEVLSPSRGAVNVLLQKLGMEPIYFVADSKWFRWVLILSSTWKEVGWQSIIYLAAISGVDPELYDVADIDGAGRLRKVISITLPAIAPTIIIMMILSVGNIIRDDFDQVYNLLNSNVLAVGEVISTYSYKLGLVQMNYSMSTAVGLFKNIISFVMVMIANRIASKVSDGENTLL